MPDTIVDPNMSKDEEVVTKGGRRIKGATVKQLKKMLKKAGLKTTGKRAALTRRAKKAHLKMKGGEVMEGSVETLKQGGGSALAPQPLSGGRRRSRRSRGFKLF